jgi:hypothetical protein
MHHLQNDSIITISRTNTEKEEEKNDGFWIGLVVGYETKIK